MKYDLVNKGSDQRYQLSALSCLPSGNLNGSALKGKNLPLETISFLLEYTLFQKGLCVQKNKTKKKHDVTKVVPLVNNARKSNMYKGPLRYE